MIELRHALKVGTILEHQYEYYAKWYNPVIRELVAYPDFKGDFETLGKMVLPPVSAREARQSVELLLKLGMIQRRAGRFVQTEPLVGTGPEVWSTAVVNYHKTMAGLAASAYDRCKGDERNITAVTLNMTKDNLSRLVKETSAFRDRLMELAQDAGDGTKVYQVNIQIFPVSRSPGKRRT